MTTYQDRPAWLLPDMGESRLRVHAATAAEWWAAHPGERELRWTEVDLLSEPKPPKDGDEFI